MDDRSPDRREAKRSERVGQNATQEGVRTQPHSARAERAALGAVLINPAALDDLADLAVDDFFFPRHREILEAMRAVAARGRPVDLVTLSDELKVRGVLEKLDGGETYLVTMAGDAPMSDRVRHYAHVVASKATLRRIIAACAEIQSTAYGDFGSDVEAFVNEARAKLAGIELHGSGGPVRVGTVLDNVADEIEKRGKAPAEYLVPTGIAKVDRKIGGLRREHLIVVAARPGGGKTAWAINTCAVAAALAGIPTLVFSLEMSTQELLERALAREALVNGHAIGLGRLGMAEWIRIHEAKGKLYEIPLEVDDRVLRTQQLLAEARRWRARNPGPLALIVVDYVGLVESDKEERTREREIAKISGALKKLAKKLKCPVVLCCQLNRDSVGKDGKMRPPTLRDLRESGAIEQDADVVIFPWWDTKPPASGRHPASLIFGKYRGGHPGTVKVDWMPEYTVFVEPEEPEEDPQEDLPL